MGGTDHCNVLVITGEVGSALASLHWGTLTVVLRRCCGRVYPITCGKVGGIVVSEILRRISTVAQKKKNVY